MVGKSNEMAFPHLQRFILFEAVLLHFWIILVQLSAGSECSASECKIERILTPAYVTASYEHRPALSGCVSREHSPTGQEVHVVLVRESAAPTLSGTSNAVDVTIKPSSHFSGLERTIFVLASTQPTNWRVQSEHSSNESLGLILVSKNSTVSYDRRTRLKTRKQDLPVESQKLMKWARKKWKVVTSLIEAGLASVVTLYVGDNASATEKCEILPQLPNIYVSHIELQDIRGCVSRWKEDPNGMDVHVIELLSPTVDNVEDGRVDVNVDVRSKSRPVKSRHVVLVLKSHASVRWHVTTRNLRGTLDIITDQTVESNGTNTQSFRVAVEPLIAFAGQELIDWTCDKYGAPLSYTEAEIANRLTLVVGKNITFSSQPGPSTAMTLVRENHGKDGRPPSHDRLHPADGGDFRSDEVKSQIIRSVRIECSEDHLMVVIPKAALVYRRLPPESVSFRDVSCESRTNRSHHVLFAEALSCGTTNNTTPNSVEFMNAIMIEWRSNGVQGSGNSSSSETTERVFDPIHIMIEIRCEYPIAATSKEVMLPQSLDIKFRLRLFRDAEFQNEIVTFPEVVDESRNIFVQANITADICMQINVQNCSLKADKDVSRPLIVNGCIMDESIVWARVDGEGSRQSRHFQASLRKFTDGNHKLNFRCELAVCTVCQSSVVPSIPLCKSRENHCGDWGAATRDKRLIVSVLSGPLKVVSHDDGVPAHKDRTTSGPTERTYTPRGQPLDPPPLKHNCEQIVQVEGLSMEIVISIAFAAFIIGILLMASLWYIYVRTGPGSLKSKSGLQSASNSGDSTPSSTVPITIHQVATSHR